MNPDYSIFDPQVGLNDYLQKDAASGSTLPDLSQQSEQSSSQIVNNVTGLTNPSSLTDGEMPAVLFYGKISFGDTTAGFRMGLGEDNTYKFIIGNSLSSLDWNVTTANVLTVKGSIVADSGSIGGFDIGSDYIRDSENSFGLASTVTGGDDVRFWAGDTYDNRATAPFRVTEAGVLYSESGFVGGWEMTSSLLRSASSGVRIELDKGENRISIFDASEEKVVIGYLDGLPKNDGSGNWTSSNYGIWARSGDMLSIDGDSEYVSGDWIIRNDASYLVHDASDNVIIRLGTDTGEKGLFIYDTGANQLAKLISDQIYIGASGNSLSYDTLNGLVIEGDITATTGSIGGFDIGSDYVRDSANTFGLASTATGGTDVRFWAGDTFANRATAPFRVYESGEVISRSSPIQTYSPANGGTATLDCSLSNDHRVTLSNTASATATIAISNVITSQKFLVSITQGSGGSGTVTWFGTIRWVDGAEPVLSQTGGKRDTFGFICTGTGTYDGFIVGLYL